MPGSVASAAYKARVGFKAVFIISEWARKQSAGLNAAVTVIRHPVNLEVASCPS